MTVDSTKEATKRLRDILREANRIIEYGWFNLTKKDSERLTEINNEIIEIIKNIS